MLSIETTEIIMRSLKDNFKGENQMSSSIIKYSEDLQGYVATDKTIVKKVKRAHEQDYINYYKQDYCKIFPEYNEETDRIQLWDRVQYGCIGLSGPDDNNESQEIPNGVYRMKLTEHGPLIVEMQLEGDKYINLRGTEGRIYQDVKNFLEKRHIFEKEQLRHKRGCLLYGEPGNGKTREVCKVLERCKEDNIIGLFVPSSIDLDYLLEFREGFTGKNVVIILEELTERTNGGRSVEELLSFLDGESSWNNCYVIATTNYPENLPNNVIDRPGRFDIIIDFPCPTDHEKELYLLGRNVDPAEIPEILDQSDKMSLDYLVHAVTEGRIWNKKICDVLKEMKERKRKIKDSFEKQEEALGF